MDDPRSCQRRHHRTQLLYTPLFCRQIASDSRLLIGGRFLLCAIAAGAGIGAPPAHSITIARPADGLSPSVRAIDGGGFASRFAVRLRLGSFSDARTNRDAIPERLPIIADESQRRQVAKTHRRRYDRVGEVVDLRT